MIIISHRGYWLNPAEKNTEIAFRRSFELGFGTETDVRDCMGELMIAHDMPIGTELALHSFLSLLPQTNLPLAINIKADGLAVSLSKAMKEYPPSSWFVFDMSIPDMLAHLKVGNPVYARMSEVEKEPVWFDRLSGVWLDSFEDEWFDLDLIQSLIRNGKRVCVVSSELHGRENSALWTMLLPLVKEQQLMLCTDFPEHARRFFYGALR